MLGKHFSLIVFLLFPSFIYAFQPIVEDTSQRVTVVTSRGQVLGYHVNYGNDKSQLYYGEADIFKGIPYVLPPVGDLRYQVIFKVKKL
jgi:hypothetical protein